MKVVQLHSQGSARFDEFWQAYPRHIGKCVAQAKWDKITNGGLSTRTLDKDSGTYVSLVLKATDQEIIDGAKRYRKSQVDPNTYKLKDDGRYIPYASTWLNRGGWMDE